MRSLNINDYFGEPPIDIEGNTSPLVGYNVTKEIYDNGTWIVAIDAWDYGDSSILTKMLLRHQIPFELQPLIADIVSGVRKPNLKAVSKMKVPVGHRIIIIGIYLTLKKDVCETVISGKSIPSYHVTADEMGVEVIELKRQYEERHRRFKKEFAEMIGLSVSSLENMALDVEKKINRYPHL